MDRNRDGAADAPKLSSGDFERLRFEGMTFADRYKLLTGAVVPRPIAFVSSLNHDGSVNAAPFSSFMIASIEAGYLAFSVGPGDAVEKETLRNVRRNQEFVINSVSEELAREVQFCGEEHAPGTQKIAVARLELIASERIKTPRIANTKIQFECGLHKIVRFGGSHMIVGEVLLMHAERGLVRNGKIDPLELAPLGRIAGRNYCSVREIISV
jgi:flavin reductase (DIM6/NTAB) family NADH-FMN oxidoreductase RutF